MGAVPEPSADFLVVSGITKHFGGVRALRGVDLALRAGEVHGLVGANGAGKSTLIRILAGVETADGGILEIDGLNVVIDSPHRAADLGLSFIHQELNLVPQLSALENLVLGAPKPTRFGLVDWRRVRALAQPVAAGVGIGFPLDAKVATLSTAQRWLLSIGRALMRRARLIVMDEPTASLSTVEAEALFRIVRKLRADGIAILYVSHRLDEILDLCDRVTAFRDGSRVATIGRKDLSRRRLIEAIVGGEPGAEQAPEAAHQAHQRDPVLVVTGLERQPAVRGVGFALGRGEVLGFAGLVGAGRSELMRMVFGADRPQGGSMVLAGKKFAPGSPGEAVRAGIGLVPEERRSEGLILHRSVVFNMALPSNARFSRWLLLDMQRRAAWASDISARMLVKTPSVETAVHKLSGGNQQKVVIGRWIDRDLKVLILDEPSRGVDIGARAEIHRMIRDLADNGLSVIVVSSEPEELPGLCDRVLVMAEGRIVDELSGAALTREGIVRASYRHGPDQAAA